MKLSFEEILKNSKSAGSHDYVINNTFSFLNKNISETESLAIEIERTNIHKVKKKIGDLKLLRVQADYHNLEIDQNKSDKALELSQEIMSKLKTFAA